MEKDLSEITLTDLIRKLWPSLSAEDREIVATAKAKLSMIDTWSQTPAGRTETNYHGEAYESLKSLSARLLKQRRNDPLVAELYARYGKGKQPI